MQWPKELLDRAMKMSLQGFTTARIADELSKAVPGITGCAVIGQLYRLRNPEKVKAREEARTRRRGAEKRPLRRQANGAVESPEPPPAPEPRLPVRTPTPGGRFSIGMKRPPIVKAPKPIEQTDPALLVEAIRAGARSLLDLAFDECRFSIGQNGEGTHFFCAQPARDGSPYCEAHARRCFCGTVPKCEIKEATALK